MKISQPYLLEISQFVLASFLETNLSHILKSDICKLVPSDDALYISLVTPPISMCVETIKVSFNISSGILFFFATSPLMNTFRPHISCHEIVKCVQSCDSCDISKERLHTRPSMVRTCTRQVNESCILNMARPVEEEFSEDKEIMLVLLSERKEDQEDRLGHLRSVWGTQGIDYESPLHPAFGSLFCLSPEYRFSCRGRLND